jgi:hypothetical protein
MITKAQPFVDSLWQFGAVHPRVELYDIKGLVHCSKGTNKLAIDWPNHTRGPDFVRYRPRESIQTTFATAPGRAFDIVGSKPFR